MRMQLVLDRPTIQPSVDVGAVADAVRAAVGDPPENAGDSNAPSYRPFHSVLMMTNTWTGDKRIFTEVSWRDLPLPLMGVTRTLPEHMEAELIGRIDRIELQGDEVHAWGVYLNDDAVADRFHQLVMDGFLRGVSVDLDDIEAELVIPAEVIEAEDELFDGEREDGEDIVIPLGGEQLRVTHSRIMGATVLPFPALQEAFIENTALAAAGRVALAKPPIGYGKMVPTGWVVCDECEERTFSRTEFGPVPLIARGAPYEWEVPVAPPGAWLEDQKLTESTPLTITDEGQISGHLAAWGSCHIGFPDRCVTPPRSLSNYSHFHLGQLITAEGERVAVGKITFGTGHAPLSASAPAALAHYDNTGAVAGHVRAGEDQFGIWIAGGLMPGLSPNSIRLILGSDLSGDWRLIGNGLELVAALAVNVPGFHKPRQSVRTFTHDGMLASLVASLPVLDTRAPLDPDVAEAIINRIARSVGRSKDQRIAAAVRRVQQIRGR